MRRTDDTMVYAALGDSMSIDDYAGGPGRGAASLLWRNGDDDFPAWAGRDLTAQDPGARLLLLASDGATSTTVAGEQLGRLPPAPPGRRSTRPAALAGGVGVVGRTQPGASGLPRTTRRWWRMCMLGSWAMA